MVVTGLLLAVCALHHICLWLDTPRIHSSRVKVAVRKWTCTVSRIHAICAEHKYVVRQSSGTCDMQVDIYSVGIILWELVTLMTPARGNLRSVKVPEECPAEVAHLIEDCLNANNPDKRPSCQP